MPVDTAEDIAVSFKFFGLATSSSLATVKEAYKRYVKEFHPDLFPKDSTEQKMAAEKMIAANSHFEKLEKFFKEFPEGRPRQESAERQEPHDESDWEAWEKQRHDSFDDELKDWKERQSKIEKEKSTNREAFRRGKLVRNCRVGLVLITLALWAGWFSECASLDKKTEATEERQRGDANNPHPQPRYIDPVTHRDVDQDWKDKIAKLRRDQGFVNPEDKQKEMPGRIILLLLWTGGAGWLLLSSKGKALAYKYLAEADK